MSELPASGRGGIGLARAYLRRRHTILFYTLLCTMVAVPLCAAFELTGALIDFLLAASLLAAVMPVDSMKGSRGLLTVAALIWLARPLTLWLDHPILSTITLGFWTLLGLVAAAVACDLPCGQLGSMPSTSTLR